MATKKTETTVVMKPLKIKQINARIVGDTPLIVHAWGFKEKRMMLEAQMGKNKTKKKPCKMPFDDFAQSLYWLTEMPTETIVDPGTQEEREVVTEELFEKAVEDGARFGFPANSFKQAANSAAYRLGWVKNQMELRGSYFLSAPDGDYFEIKGAIPEPREDMVRIGMGSADLRYRGEFAGWYADLTLEYNASGNMTLDQIVNCIQAGGFACGIGEWRPEKDGSFGTFHVAADDELK